MNRSSAKSEILGLVIFLTKFVYEILSTTFYGENVIIGIKNLEFFQKSKKFKKKIFPKNPKNWKFSNRSHFLRSTFLKPCNSLFDAEKSKFYDKIGFDLRAWKGGAFFNPFLLKSRFWAKIYGLSEFFFRSKWRENNSTSHPSNQNNIYNSV